MSTVIVGALLLRVIVRCVQRESGRAGRRCDDDDFVESTEGGESAQWPCQSLPLPLFSSHKYFAVLRVLLT